MTELIRKSPALLRILGVIDAQWLESEFYGLLISKETGLLAGTVYPILHRMKGAGLLTDRIQHSENSPPRRYYKLTEEGLRYMDAMRPLIKWQAEQIGSVAVSPWPAKKPQPVPGLRMTTTLLIVCKGVKQYEGQRFYCRPLVEATGINSSSVDAILKRMTRKGLLRCEPEPDAELSQRKIARPKRLYYTVTPEGAAFLEGITEHLSPQVHPPL